MKSRMQIKLHKASRSLLILLFAVILMASVAAAMPNSTSFYGIISATPIPATLSPGERFNTTISISENPGFAAMLIRISIPSGIELIGFRADSLQATDCEGFFLSIEYYNLADDGISLIHPITDSYIFAGWMARATNLYNDGNLFTLNFKVSSDIQDVQNTSIYIAFANARDYNLPTDAQENELNIALPGGITGEGQSARIGQAAICHSLRMVIKLDYIKITNRDTYEISFEVAVFNLNLPQNERIYFDCDAHDAIRIDVDISGIRGISISGFVKDDGFGVARGDLILTVDGEITTSRLNGLINSLLRP